MKGRPKYVKPLVGPAYGYLCKNEDPPLDQYDPDPDDLWAEDREME